MGFEVGEVLRDLVQDFGLLEQAVDGLLGGGEGGWVYELGVAPSVTGVTWVERGDLATVAGGADVDCTGKVVGDVGVGGVVVDVDAEDVERGAGFFAVHVGGHGVIPFLLGGRGPEVDEAGNLVKGLRLRKGERERGRTGKDLGLDGGEDLPGTDDDATDGFLGGELVVHEGDDEGDQGGVVEDEATVGFVAEAPHGEVTVVEVAFQVGGEDEGRESGVVGLPVLEGPAHHVEEIPRGNVLAEEESQATLGFQDVEARGVVEGELRGAVDAVQDESVGGHVS